MQISPPIALSEKQQHLIAMMRRALIDRRMPVEIDEFVFRFARRGETFEDGDHTIQALESGILVRCPAQSSDGQPAQGRWLGHGSSDDLEDLMFKRFLVGKPEQEVEALALGIAASCVLTDISVERRAARESGRSPRPR